MKKILLYGLLILMNLANSKSESTDVAAIKDLVRKVDDSMSRGHIFHINYSVEEQRTDFFYERNRALIQFFEKNKEEALKPSSSISNPDDPAKSYYGLLECFKKNLTYFREGHYDIDYIVDGTGFYLKKTRSWIDDKGVSGRETPMIFASDGKIMGSFYLDDARGVLQPAMERPPIPERYWGDIVYLFGAEKLADAFANMEKLSVAQKENTLLVSGELWGKAKRLSTLVLVIDQSSMEPMEMTYTDYDPKGKLNRIQSKKWEFKDFAGVRLPSVVTDQTYEVDFDFKPHLATQEIFTINAFSPLVKSTKETLVTMLKANFSMYDEITGSHYLSGNPEDVLNKLSK